MPACVRTFLFRTPISRSESWSSRPFGEKLMQRTIELARTATARTSTSVETAAQPEPNEELRVEHVATAKLPTKYGDFQIVAF